MDKYEYLPIEQAKEGDVVEYVGTGHYSTPGTLHIITSANGLIRCSTLGNGIGWTKNTSSLKLIKTKPGSEAKIGDEVIYYKASNYLCEDMIGKIYTVENESKDLIDLEDIGWFRKEDIKVLCKPKLNQHSDSPNNVKPEKLMLPKEIGGMGWWVGTIKYYGSDCKYLRKDLNIYNHCTNEGFWKTEAEALAARAKYYGEDCPDLKNPDSINLPEGIDRYKPGTKVKRIGCGMAGLPKGYKTHIIQVHTSNNSSSISLVIKDKTGKSVIIVLEKHGKLLKTRQIQRSLK